jgi:Fe/S biogenesis protein NfuA
MLRKTMRTIQEIQQMLDEQVNPLLKNHNGKVEILHLIDAYGGAGRQAQVVMSGGCQGCSGAKYTLSMFVAGKIKEFDPTVGDVLDISDHSDKSKAYFKE